MAEDERSALVTGANRGIGLAIARGLVEAGMTVFLGTRDSKAGDEAAHSLHGLGLQATPVSLDLTRCDTLDAAVREIYRSGRKVDVLINNAGILHEKPILDLAEDEIADSIAVHLAGPLRLIRLTAPGMVERGYGRIVNVSSGWGAFAEGLGGPGLYGVTKAALNALTVRLGKELPNAVKVNAMCPGWVRTRMGGRSAPRSPTEAADTAIWLATLPSDGPTGGFFRDRRPIPW